MIRLIARISFLFFLGALNAFGGQQGQQPPGLGGGAAVSSSLTESISTLGVDIILPSIDSLTDEGTASLADDIN